MNLYLRDDLKKYFSADLPLFEQIMALRGECFRQQKGRLTQRIFLGDKSYFIKQHRGVGWKEIFKNIFQGRWPVLGAENEWRALETLQVAGIPVPLVVGYGKRYLNPARQESFILMEELTSTTSLEELGTVWKKSPPELALKRQLIKKVAHIAQTMHALGMNHRDFYLCHFLLDKALEKDQVLYLIDLHRAQIRKKIPQRWCIKDLAGLYFSSKDMGLTQRDGWRFIQAYTGKSLSVVLKTQKDLWEKVKRRGEQLYCDHNT